MCISAIVRILWAVCADMGDQEFKISIHDHDLSSDHLEFMDDDFLFLQVDCNNFDDTLPLYEGFNHAIMQFGLKVAISYGIVGIVYGSSLAQWVPHIDALELLFEFAEFTSTHLLQASVQGSMRGACDTVVTQSIQIRLARSDGRKKYEVTIELSDVNQLGRALEGMVLEE